MLRSLLPIALAWIIACTGSAFGENRLALVIGNGAYAASPLKNPVNDARSMAAMLKRLGFAVLLKENATKQQMDEALQRFGDYVTKYRGVGLVYYSGHGVQMEGENYLIPVDATLARKDDLKYQTVHADQVLDKLSQAQVKILILDACRTSLFRSFSRGLSGGLAQMTAARGTLLAYATAPNTTASDGAGNNSPYAETLLRVLPIPDVPLELSLKRAAQIVDQQTHGVQTPWYESAIIGNFVMAPRTMTAPTASSAQQNPGSPVHAEAHAIGRVMKTPSGISYTDVVLGNGSAPQIGQHVTVTSMGFLAGGKKFSETTALVSLVFGDRRMIPGLWDGMRTMREGGRRMMKIPPQLAFGERGNKNVPPNTEVIYNVSLISVGQ